MRVYFCAVAADSKLDSTEMEVFTSGNRKCNDSCQITSGTADLSPMHRCLCNSA
jgi:hypothetical protein